MSESSTAPRPRVAVCVSTLQRPQGLERLLRSLDRLTFDGARPELLVAVTDNDADGSARDLVARLASELSFEVDYAVEPRRGITWPRNAAIERMRERVDFVVFVDDDEEMDPDWLATLLEAQRRTGAEIVTGPQLPRFEDPPPPWIAAWFEPPRHATDTEVDRAFTNNVMLHTDVLADPDARFDVRFGVTGGSDTHLFRKLHRKGRRIVWVDDAVGREWVPASRARVGWILRRAYRYGTTTAVIERDLEPWHRVLVNILAVGCYRILKGLVCLPFSLLLGKGRWLTYVRHICYGSGLVAGWLGVRYREYRRVHGG